MRDKLGIIMEDKTEINWEWKRRQAPNWWIFCWCHLGQPPGGCSSLLSCPGMSSLVTSRSRSCRVCWLNSYITALHWPLYCPRPPAVQIYSTHWLKVEEQTFKGARSLWVYVLKWSCLDSCWPSHRWKRASACEVTRQKFQNNQELRALALVCFETFGA